MQILVVRQLVKRAEEAGFKAIALTIDAPRLGRRESEIKNRFALPRGLTLKNFLALDLGKIDKTNALGLASYVGDLEDQSLSWKDIKWLQSITNLPILVKGVITAEDTRIAVEYGAAGIIVSNHGGRQLEYVPATIMALEEVVKAVEGRIPVFLDGGVRRGTDVFKALALGASAVFVSSFITTLFLAFHMSTLTDTTCNTLLLVRLGREAEFVRASSGGRGLSEEDAANAKRRVRADNGT
ncbi:unnamed protein product [Thlaspi arvense]|uniref:(S)-2-hydroxy-acid oxidase n=1 Tax=Thlaspi arvense TaxID=13288 RepID=A0AAU9T2S9_THLAR|nr:unnamed protein product [Thlaspi arvense]